MLGPSKRRRVGFFRRLAAFVILVAAVCFSVLFLLPIQYFLVAPLYVVARLALPRLSHPFASTPS